MRTGIRPLTESVPPPDPAVQAVFPGPSERVGTICPVTGNAHLAAKRPYPDVAQRAPRCLPEPDCGKEKRPEGTVRHHPLRRFATAPVGQETRTDSLGHTVAVRRLDRFRIIVAVQNALQRLR
jgi:hypothetical protein